MDETILLTVKEFQLLVGISESSVFRLIRLGLPSRKIPCVGRRILKKQALAWLEAGGAAKKLARLSKKIITKRL